MKDRHQTPDQKRSNYAGVVTWDNIHIVLTYASLNELQVIVADVQNAYLQALSSEKYYIVCNDDFGIENRGTSALIRRVLYGEKMTGHDYWVHIRSYMKEIGFTSCQGDPDI